MYKLSKKSLERLSTCDERLQEICKEAIQVMDFSVLEGYRDEQTQNKLFNEGKSKLKYPQSKHNQNPSKAVDLAPYPINWADTGRFSRLAGLIVGIASQKGVKLRWGGTWGNIGDDIASFADYPHFEIIED